MNLPDDKLMTITGSDQTWPTINIGCGEDLTIRELSELIANVVGFKNHLLFDHSKPDGTPRKLLDIGRLRTMGWKARISLREGVAMAYESFLENNQLIASANRMSS